jgi:hypothetical protein
MVYVDKRETYLVNVLVHAGSVRTVFAHKRTHTHIHTPAHMRTHAHTHLNAYTHILRQIRDEVPAIFRGAVHCCGNGCTLCCACLPASPRDMHTYVRVCARTRAREHASMRTCARTLHRMYPYTACRKSTSRAAAIMALTAWRTSDSVSGPIVLSARRATSSRTRISSTCDARTSVRLPAAKRAVSILVAPEPKSRAQRTSTPSAAVPGPCPPAAARLSEDCVLCTAAAAPSDIRRLVAAHHRSFKHHTAAWACSCSCSEGGI